jgi:hypothetical protein
MDSALTERRSEPRQPAKALEIERATLRPGCLVAVLDVSANGAQVQSERPRQPGSIHVRVVARIGRWPSRPTWCGAACGCCRRMR